MYFEKKKMSKPFPSPFTSASLRKTVCSQLASVYSHCLRDNPLSLSYIQRGGRDTAKGKEIFSMCCQHSDRLGKGHSGIILTLAALITCFLSWAFIFIPLLWKYYKDTIIQRTGLSRRSGRL